MKKENICNLPAVVKKKVWMPIDEHKNEKRYVAHPWHNEWEDRGGSWAFLVQYFPNDSQSEYEIWVQSHRGYRNHFSVRSYHNLEDALVFWSLLDKEIQFRELPGPYVRTYARKSDNKKWIIYTSGEWDGLFPNGKKGHHDYR